MLSDLLHVKDELGAIASSLGLEWRFTSTETPMEINMFVGDFKYARIYLDCSYLSGNVKNPIVDVDCYIPDEPTCCYPLMWYAIKEDEDPGDFIRTTVTELLSKYIKGDN